MHICLRDGFNFSTGTSICLNTINPQIWYIEEFPIWTKNCAVGMRTTLPYGMTSASGMLEQIFFSCYVAMFVQFKDAKTSGSKIGNRQTFAIQ